MSRCSWFHLCISVAALCGSRLIFRGYQTGISPFYGNGVPSRHLQEEAPPLDSGSFVRSIAAPPKYNAKPANTNGVQIPAPKWRKFVSYTSSQWEQLWLQNVGLWTKRQSICKVLQSPEQSPYMHDFLNLTCSARYKPPYDHWCIIDDAFQPMWYNTANRDSYE